jgi:hypothetical protein
MSLKELIDMLTEIARTHPSNAEVYVSTDARCIRLRKAVRIGFADMAVILEGED